MREETLADEGGDESFRHCLVVLAGVADISEDLCQRLLVVDAHEMAVLFKFLLIFIIGVNVLTQIVVVGLLMYETLQWQTVGEGRLLIGPSHRERGHGHHQLRQLEDIDDLLRLVDRCTEVTVAQSFLIHEVTERLRVEQSVCCSIDE